MKKIIYIFSLLVITLSLSNCLSDDLDPSLDQNKSKIETVSDLESIMLGAYNRMSHKSYYGRDFIIFGEVRTDNVFANGRSGRFKDVGEFKLFASSSYSLETWSKIYSVIASCNLIIQTKSSELKGDKSKINHIKGQAYAVRALAHFDLLKLFGQQHITGGNNIGIPYITSYGEEHFPKANTVNEVKDFIVKDLNTAKNHLTVLDKKGFKGNLRQEVTQFFPDALLSRVFLYFGMWNEAKEAAKNVIDSKHYTIINKDNFISSFGKDGSFNTIFAIANDPIDNQSINSLGYIYGNTSYGDIELSKSLLNLFDKGDIRGENGIIGYAEGSRKLRNLKKFPTNLGYDDINIIRYEEVILNYAEALWRINSSNTETVDMLNSITQERGAKKISSVTEDIILNERRKELMFEGFRFDDLIRTKKSIEADKGTVKIPYGDSKLAFPIPQKEIDASYPNLKQNIGY